jgi:hypothetical protein
MADFDPVGIAMQNAVTPLSQRAVDAQSQTSDNRENQIMQQSFQATSLAQRSQEMAQQQNQFDVVQKLRDQQFDLQKQQSMATLAAMSTDQQIKQVQLQEATRKLIQAPLQQKAGVDFQNILNDATNSTDPGDFDAKIQAGVAQNPDIVRNFPGGIQAYNASVLSAKSAFLSGAQQQLFMKQKVADQETTLKAQDLGLNPQDFMTASPDGNSSSLDMGGLRQAVSDAQIQRTNAAEQFKSDLEGQRQQANISARNQGALEVVNQRLLSNESRIKNSQQREQYSAERRDGQVAYKQMMAASPGSDAYNQYAEEYKDHLAKADAIYAGSTGSSSTLSDSVAGLIGGGGGNSNFSAVPTQGAPAASGGYVVGRTYGGGAKYLGGDPNSPNSWSK